MEGEIKEIWELINKISKGEISKKEAEREIDSLERKYGKNILAYYTPPKKLKPWNEEYLKELKKFSLNGVWSKDFIVHFAEVSENIYMKKRLKKIFLILVIVLLIVIGIIAFMTYRR